MTNPLVAAIPGIAKSIMGGLDALFTSDDERNKARIIVEQNLNQLTESVLSFVASMEAERTKRHAADMQSDSWLSKNIRPLTLVYLLGIFTVLALADSISVLDFEVAPHYVSLLEALLLAAFGFYFVSRGVEKVAQAVKSMRSGKTEVE
jgi:hypothetical protein